MSSKQKFLDILKVELNDLETDLDLLVDEYKKRKKNNEITDYVFLENLAVLKREMYGIDNLIEAVDSVKSDTFSNLDDMAEEIKKRIAETIAHHDLSEALLSLSERKMKKAQRYCEELTD